MSAISTPDCFSGERPVLIAGGGCAFIGADGLWSAIRAQLVGDGKPRVSGHIAYRAALPIAEVPEPQPSPQAVRGSLT